MTRHLPRNRTGALIGPPRSAVTSMILAAGVVGLSVLGACQTGSSGQPTASPAPSVTLAPTVAPSVEPSVPPSVVPSVASSPSTVAAPELTETFTSERHGLTISYPAGWRTRAATESWTTVGPPTFASAAGDFLFDPTRGGELFLGLASQPLGGKDGDQWVDDRLTWSEWGDSCDPPIEPVDIDGSPGRVVLHCAVFPSAATWAGDRGYHVALYSTPDEPALDAVYDLDYFRTILATMQLTPEDAVD